MSKFEATTNTTENKMVPFSALTVNRYIRALRDAWSPVRPDKKSEQMVVDLFKILEKIKPEMHGDDKHWTIWTAAKRPTFEEYKAAYYYDYYEDGDEPNSDEELMEFWAGEYTEENIWYSMHFVYAPPFRAHEAYYGVFIDGNYIIGLNDINVKDYERVDETEFVSWLTDAVNDAIQKVEDGIYNDWVKNDLPYCFREGTISRKDYYDAYPEERKKFRDDLAKEEIDKFCALAKKKKIPAEERIKLTPRDFFEACTLGYKVSGFKKRKIWRFEETDEEKNRYKDDFTPREYYSMYADGRDDGLVNVPLDDSAAFAEWRKEKGPYYEFNGHHPFEVVGSYNISHSIHLIPHFEDDSGEGYLLLSCNAASTSYYIVKWLNAIADKFPILLWDGDKVAARYEETDRIGIAPCTDFLIDGDNRSGRLGSDVLDAMYLPDGYEKILDKIEWVQEPVLEMA